MSHSDQYAAGTGNTACKDCPDGHHCSSTTLNPTPCNAGRKTHFTEFIFCPPHIHSKQKSKGLQISYSKKLTYLVDGSHYRLSYLTTH